MFVRSIVVLCLLSLFVVVIGCGDDDDSSTNSSSPDMRVSPSALGFSPGENVHYLIVQNDGTGTLNWSATAADAWVMLDPASSSVTTSHDTLTVEVNRSLVQQGIVDTSYIYITSDGGNDTILVDVVN
jgi:hypothetical protein